MYGSQIVLLKIDIQFMKEPFGLSYSMSDSITVSPCE